MRTCASRTSAGAPSGEGAAAARVSLPRARLSQPAMPLIIRLSNPGRPSLGRCSGLAQSACNLMPRAKSLRALANGTSGAHAWALLVGA